MKKMFLVVLAMGWLGYAIAQELKPIELVAPDKTRGLPVMQALSARASVRDWSSKPLTMQDLSDLVWAANGVNRPDGRRTAPSARNSQDVDVYVLMQDGAYVYNAAKNLLEHVVAGDYRELAGKTDAPVTLVLISDISRFPGNDDAGKSDMANIDGGIVSQNISLFCAGVGLKTRPRASFPALDKLREVLKLSASQRVILNHPVGYAKE
jgi:nitroreductase